MRQPRREIVRVVLAARPAVGGVSRARSGDTETVGGRCRRAAAGRGRVALEGVLELEMLVCGGVVVRRCRLLLLLVLGATARRDLKCVGLGRGDRLENTAGG